MALQRLGEADRRRLLQIVSEWVEDPDPLVRRAAVAAICEPRLITEPSAAAAAIGACPRATDLLRARPAGTRRLPACGRCVRHCATTGAWPSQLTRSRASPRSTPCAAYLTLTCAG
jgi:hypothetical protein